MELMSTFTSIKFYKQFQADKIIMQKKLLKKQTFEKMIIDLKIQ